jgi:hypothetical protein
MPTVGSVLRSVGVRLYATIEPARESAVDGVIEVPGPPSSHPIREIYSVTGVASEPRDVFAVIPAFRRLSNASLLASPFRRRKGKMERVGAEFVLTVAGTGIQVSFGGLTSDVVAGSRVTATGRFTLVGGYEWESFALVDTRAEWTVRDIRPLPDGAVGLDLTPATG